MFSKTKVKGNPPVAKDLDDKQLIYYDKNQASNRLESTKGFVPWHYGDSVVYVCGRRGSGKSTWCSKYIKSYTLATKNKENPQGNRVFLFSRFAEDPSIQLPERSLQIPLDEMEDIELEDLSDSLCVFDDIHSATLTTKQISIIESFVVDCIENSRHFNISLCITSHMCTNYRKTRSILNEASSIVVFPEFSNPRQINYALKEYFGLTKKQITMISKTPNTRWVQIRTINPRFVLSEHLLYTL